MLPVVCDVSRAGEIGTVARQARERFGKIDIPVNNAAILVPHIGAGPAHRPFDALAGEAWDRVRSVNVKGPRLRAQSVFPDRRAGLGPDDPHRFGHGLHGTRQRFA